MSNRVNRLPKELREVGAVVVRAGQLYRLDRIEPHQCRTGRITTLAVWCSTCTDCGASFEFRSTVAQQPENRRCAMHKRPGFRVGQRFLNGQTMES
jgi:hypothetical protein